ncbi:MAG: RdgB/HAM1 family non-canonical purine NTP pyrophosphatase [Clostridia bacterium]|nr:RdgB/HAM1 family non-canonical purine NTP pyrophosphatase [Clostridia bacterium]
MEIILASNNEHKLKEIRAKLKNGNIKIISQKEAGFNIEVDETGTTFEENAILKAETIYKLAKKPVLAEDGGLEVDYLNGKPGVYSHRFAGENATDEDRRNKILTLLKDVPDEKRTARFRCVGCYIDENGQKHIFEGISEGKIGYESKGTDGFGYDPIFICEYGKTFAEISAEEKNKISHRGRLIEKFVKYLEEK